jgi:hypothetical protein
MGAVGRVDNEKGVTGSEATCNIMKPSASQYNQSWTKSLNHLNAIIERYETRQHFTNPVNTRMFLTFSHKLYTSNTGYMLKFFHLKQQKKALKTFNILFIFFVQKDLEKH